MIDYLHYLYIALHGQNRKLLKSQVNTNANGYAEVKSGKENEYNFIEETNNNWILIYFNAASHTSKAKTIKEAVKENYIEPLVLVQSRLIANRNLGWKDFINILDGNSTDVGGYPVGILVLKVKSKASLTSIKFTTDYDWDNESDGLGIWKIDNFELSTKPF